MPGLGSFDLAAYLRERAPGAKPTGAPLEWLHRCPRCSGAEHLYINIEKRCGHCFRCGWSPGLVDLLAELEHRPRREILARIARHAAPRRDPDLEALRARVLALGARWPAPRVGAPALPLPDAYIPLAAHHDGATERALGPFRDYLARRRISEDHIARHRIGCALVGRYQGRVILPVFTEGRLFTYQARDITGRAPAKYLGPPGAALGQVLFNLDHARRYPQIVLCEGIISALCAGPDAVASFGKALKPGQVALLAHAGRPVTVLYDAAKAKTGAAAAHAEAHAAAERLQRAGLTVRIARLQCGDPADHPPEVVRDALAVAVPLDPLEGVRSRLGCGI